MTHIHHHDGMEWPFRSPINTLSFTTRFVLDKTLPILEVYHEMDGDWQFLCGTTTAQADVKLVCMGCMAELDSSLLELADLPPGWQATRSAPGQAWSCQIYEGADDDRRD